MTAATFADKARVAFGTAPDWIEELARLADAAGLKGAARRVGYSPSTLSSVLSATYRGDMGRVEEQVRGALMRVTVECPVLGEIGRDQCLDWQKRPFAATNAVRTRVYRACRAGCPHSLLTQKGPADAQP